MKRKVELDLNMFIKLTRSLLVYQLRQVMKSELYNNCFTNNLVIYIMYSNTLSQEYNYYVCELQFNN